MKIWYLLVDSVENAYKGCTPTKVTVDEAADVDDVRKSRESPNFSASKLVAYKIKGIEATPPLVVF